MEIKLQLFGGRGSSSGGNFKFYGHKMFEKGKPNSKYTRYDNQGRKRETRYFDKNGDKKKDIHYLGPPNHKYPHEHYWFKDDNGNWYRTTYEQWEKEQSNGKK